MKGWGVCWDKREGLLLRYWVLLDASQNGIFAVCYHTAKLIQHKCRNKSRCKNFKRCDDEVNWSKPWLGGGVGVYWPV